MGYHLPAICKCFVWGNVGASVMIYQLKLDSDSLRNYQAWRWSHLVWWVGYRLLPKKKLFEVHIYQFWLSAFLSKIPCFTCTWVAISRGHAVQGFSFETTSNVLINFPMASMSQAARELQVSIIFPTVHTVKMYGRKDSSTISTNLRFILKSSCRILLYIDICQNPYSQVIHKILY